MAGGTSFGERLDMLDLFFLALIAIFFVVCLAYIVACERL